MKRWGLYILSAILFAYLIIVLTFASAKMREVTCRGIRVTVGNAKGNAFIDEAEVMNMIKSGFGDIVEKPLLTVDKDSLEKVLVKNPIVESVQVYYSLDGYFHVNIKQREPVLRVMTGEGYYVDKDGKWMPLSSRFTSRVMVATGNISKTFAGERLAPFAKALQKDSFWDAYIEQIVVSQNEEIVLIPKVGDFKISLGTLDHWSEKLDKLMLFFKQGIKKSGWDQYREIKLKYENQVVCVKK